MKLVSSALVQAGGDTPAWLPALVRIHTACHAFLTVACAFLTFLTALLVQPCCELAWGMGSEVKKRTNQNSLPQLYSTKFIFFRTDQFSSLVQRRASQIVLSAQLRGQHTTGAWTRTSGNSLNAEGCLIKPEGQLSQQPCILRCLSCSHWYLDFLLMFLASQQPDDKTILCLSFMFRLHLKCILYQCVWRLDVLHVWKQ